MEFPTGNQTGGKAEVQGMAEAVIVAGARTPIGKLAGALAGFTAMDLGGFAIAAALSRARDWEREVLAQRPAVMRAIAQLA